MPMRMIPGLRAAVFLMLICGCHLPVEPPVRSNTNDPDHPDWKPAPPALYGVSQWHYGTRTVLWRTYTEFATGYAVLRRPVAASQFSRLAWSIRPGRDQQYVDSTASVDSAYVYRVELWAKGKALVTSNDYISKSEYNNLP
jgi:hypothetical protein